jgi:hypothetical protein
MTVSGWVYEAVEASGKAGASLRDVQRHIDELRFEELAVDTIEAALQQLEDDGRIEKNGLVWMISKRTSKEDALKRLFGD